MNKFTMCIVAALTMVPFSVSAMDFMTDSEMEAVSAQSGVEIGFVDYNYHLNIMNIAWGDTDCGTLILSTLRHQYSPGYVNINSIQINNGFGGTDVYNWAPATDEAGGTYISAPNHLITIDVMTFSSNGAHCPSQALRGKTAVVIGYPDGYQSIENISIDGIYLDDHPYTVKTAVFSSMQKWNYTSGPLDDIKNLGTITISGIEISTHAYVGGFESFNAVPGGKLVPINPNHRAQIVIATH